MPRFCQFADRAPTAAAGCWPANPASPQKSPAIYPKTVRIQPAIYQESSIRHSMFMTRGPGVLVTPDGQSGVGKSTMTDLLGERLSGRGHQVLLTRTPSPSAIGSLARNGTFDFRGLELSLRTRYLGEVAECAAFNRIGEALSAVLIDGQVVATWGWDVRRREVRCAYHRPWTGSLDREAIRAEAKRVTAGLRRGYDAGRVNGADAGVRPELVASAAP